MWDVGSVIGCEEETEEERERESAREIKAARFAKKA
jgi:hypothetical protein